MIFNPLAALRFGAVLVGLVGAVWLADKLIDFGRTQVHAEYAKAADLTNEHVATFTSEDEKVAAVSEAIRLKALSAARAVQGDKHPASKEQAEALNQIR